MELTEVHSLVNYPTIHKALLYEKLAKGKVRCSLCERKCIIAPDEKGFCKIRINLEGELYTLVYGDLSAIESRPIEIKPFFHYWPGTTALTFATWSCNFDCVWCQNFHLSKTPPNPAKARYISPEQILKDALHKGDAGVCASFQEPTLLTEWAISLFKLASSKGLYCCYVSNGYMSLETLKLLRKAGMDGIKIDLKGNAATYKQHCGVVNVEFVWRNIREARKMGLHVEVVTLVVTDVNDDEACLEQVIERHLKEAGADTPIHFTRYFPAYKFHKPPTSIKKLEDAYKMARKAGILFPYLGNVHGHQYENTYCPNCGEKLIQRCGYKLIRYKITKDKKCPKCRTRIPIKGWPKGRIENHNHK
jgi:pyruvate formate lyase activating enzyme